MTTATTSDGLIAQRPDETSHPGLGTQLGLRTGDALLIVDVPGCATKASALPVPQPPPLRERIIGSYGFGTTLTAPFATALERTSAALQAEGFGILTDIDVQATLRKKTGAEIAPYRILGACNPPLAQRALQADASMGLLLPCNVVVRQLSDAEVAVEFLDPNVLATVSENPQIPPLAAEVRAKLVRVMDRVTGRTVQTAAP